MAVINISDDNTNCDLRLCPGKNLYTGTNDFIGEFAEINSLEEDLLIVASGIYASDLAVKRDEREHFVRKIVLNIPVTNYHAFQNIKSDLENALFILSKDNWTINFKTKTGNAVSEIKWKEEIGATLLFSGGLDSMSAATDFLTAGEKLVLVSHNTHGNRIIDNCQDNVLKLLEGHFNVKVDHVHIKVYSRNQGEYTFPKDDERENTQRTRSFLFLSLAALVCRRKGFKKVLFMAENGQFSIHLPLNQARVGPFSTHTADPEFLSVAQRIYRRLLMNDEFEISNPFLYKTKAEVLDIMPKKLLKKAGVSASCWMISRTEDNKHCGYCIPCISRRIAFEYNGVKLNEYLHDVFKMNLDKLPVDDDKRRNITDYIEFISRFKVVTSKNEHTLLTEFPELYNSTAFDFQKAVDLYKRVAAQSFKVLENYPRMKKLIG